MGLGIAHAFAINDFVVTLCEPFDAARERARDEFTQVVASGVARGKLSQDEADHAHANIEFVGAVDDIPAGADLIIESVPELEAIKLDVLKSIEARRPVLIGSNTSSLSIDMLAGALNDPTTFCGFHFFNPVWSKSLVEIVVGTSTSAETLERTKTFARDIHKDVIVVKDSPGFATSRLGLALGLEAIRLLESGIASAEDIDTAMTKGYGHPMGPLRLTDLVGLDVRLNIAHYLETVYGDRFAAPLMLEEMVADGKLGKKSGQGFFSW
jgi:3-hydroxybutyryl-CoA dehydrogenase